MRILVVDDEAMIRKLLRQALEDSAHRVDEAESGEAGIGALQAGDYDLVITDMVMPGMGGIELIGIVTRVWPHIPVIAMSGGGRLGDEDHLQSAADLGAAATVSKPFRLRDVRAAIERVRGGAAKKDDACGCSLAS